MAVSNNGDSCDVDVTNVRQLAFFGGGRWGTVFFEELCKHVPQSILLFWVTRDAKSKREAWQRNGGREYVEFIDSWHDRLVESDGAIVATSVDRHYALARDMLSAAVPVLCEKPLAATREQLNHLCHLAHQNQCPFGIHLEFSYLTAFDDFLIRTEPIATKRIQVEWFDPEIELRDGIEKRVEYQCDIVSDQWPHVWSLISRSVKAGVLPEIDRLEYSPARTSLVGRVADIELDVKLSRRHTQRRRMINLNDGEATFDFRVEPPTATLRDEILRIAPSGFRPLGYSIRSFLAQISDYKAARAKRDLRISAAACESDDTIVKQDWPLSVDNCYTFLVSTIELSERLKKIQEDVLSRVLSGKRWESNERFPLNDEEVQMILDRWLPKGIESGAWYRPGSREIDRELATQVARSIYQRG